MLSSSHEVKTNMKKICSTAGGTPTPTTTPSINGNNPNMPTPPSSATTIYGGSGGNTFGGVNPGMGPPFPDIDSSKASSTSAAITTLIMQVSFWFVLSLKFPEMWLCLL